jgi:hypothetical protein
MKESERTPNKALERMPGSASASRLQSNALGTLPGIAQLGRSAYLAPSMVQLFVLAFSEDSD